MKERKKREWLLSGRIFLCMIASMHPEMILLFKKRIVKWFISFVHCFT